MRYAVQKKLLSFSMIFTGLLYSTSAFSIFCPNNFNSINLGDSLDSVIQSCGMPTSQNSYVKKTYASQQWVYYVQQGFDEPTSTLKLVFSNDQVVNITLTGNVRTCSPLYDNGYGSSQNKQNCIPIVTQKTQSLSSTNACGGFVRIGDTAQNVQAACGQPVFSNQQGSPSNDTNVTELQYSGPPPTKLIFENGQLTNRVQGS